MSRGGSYGGGRSSLGYLFGNDDEPRKPQVSKVVLPPPYGIDINPDDQNNPSPSPKQAASNNYPRAHGQNSGNFITDRPSTKVKSVPGGDSSLGYLFGDK
ncbi:Protein SPIRAL1-like 2 [Cucurbita argyrosperma subsp. argyrosperma]|uniref:Protein SPIRAL1-like 5 n=3 Tax=Cucurbita TaxID=3660 RepID=A0A6J1J7K0_CUCMA